MEITSNDLLDKLISHSNIKSRLTKTNNRYRIESIKKSEKEEYLSGGWEIVKELKTRLKVRILKKHDVWFEDRVWSLFARMGFQYLNSDRNFKISYTKDESIPGKQIDIFAVDQEVVLIIECKSSAKRKAKSFQKEINEISGIKKGVVSFIQKRFTGKPKIAWIFCTENIVLNENDRNRLEDHKILHLNQDDINYYEQLVDQIGITTKYQLFARFFENQQIPELQNRIPAIRGKMGGYTYYSFSIEPETILKISFILHRLNTTDDSLITYQRMVKKSRVKEIDKFLTKGGFFPNAIIININTNKELQFDIAKSSEYNSQSTIGVLHLPKKYKSAFIIDGQHRLYGYGNNDYRFSNTIPVVAFENLPSDTQANLFVEINHKQKSVPSNLLKSLDAELKWGSPYPDEAIRALKSKLAQVLSEREESPLYGRIRTGEEKKDNLRCITLTYIFDYGLNKTDLFGVVQNKKLIHTGPLYDGDLAENTLEKSYDFFKRIFSRVEDVLSNQWELGDSEGGFVARNIGFTSLIVIIWDIVSYLEGAKLIRFESKSSEYIYDNVKPYLDIILEFINGLSREELQNMNKQYGSTGVAKIRREFQRIIHKNFNDFQPDGLIQYIKESSGIYNSETRNTVLEIQKKMKDFIFNKLKDEFGIKDWWRLGVHKDIKKKCSLKKIEEGVDEPDWNFIDLIDYNKIISNNWKLLGSVFSAPKADQLKKEEKIKWIIHLNNIRKKGVHPERKDITEEEYNFVFDLKDWLLLRIVEEEEISS